MSSDEQEDARKATAQTRQDEFELGSSSRPGEERWIREFGFQAQASSISTVQLYCSEGSGADGGVLREVGGSSYL